MLLRDRETSAANDTLAGVVGHVEGRNFGLRGGDGRTERSVRVAGLHDERASGVRGGEVKADVCVPFVFHVLSVHPLPTDCQAFSGSIHLRFEGGCSSSAFEKKADIFINLYQKTAQ